MTCGAAANTSLPHPQQRPTLEQIVAASDTVLPEMPPAATGTPEAVLAASPGARQTWDRLAAVGVPALLVPAEAGGLGLGICAASTTARALGDRMPPAFVTSAVLATRVLCSLGAMPLLAELATGDRVLAVDVAGRSLASHPQIEDSLLWIDHGPQGAAIHLIDSSPAQQIHPEPHHRGSGLVATHRAGAAMRLPAHDGSAAVTRALDDAAIVSASGLLGAADKLFKHWGVTSRPDELVPTELWLNYATWCSDNEADDRALAAERARRWSIAFASRVNEMRPSGPGMLRRIQSWRHLVERHQTLEVVTSGWHATATVPPEHPVPHRT